jgi:uncharacterized protein YfaQ (DUF2300 family)
LSLQRQEPPAAPKGARSAKVPVSRNNNHRDERRIAPPELCLGGAAVARMGAARVLASVPLAFSVFALARSVWALFVFAALFGAAMV